MKISYTQATLSADSGIPIQTINKAIACGDLPAIRSGRRYVILAEDALGWLKKSKERGVIPTPISDDGRERLAELNRSRRTRVIA